jgi:hypothetical protein
VPMLPPAPMRAMAVVPVFVEVPVVVMGMLLKRFRCR